MGGRKMKITNKWFLNITFVLLLTFILTACSSSQQGSSEQPENQEPSNESSSESPKYGGTLTTANSAHPDTLDPHKTASIYTHGIVGMVYNKLVTYPTGADQYSDYSVIPDLAHDWEISEDQLEYTFHLRDDVKWQDIPPVNGRPFVADDVIVTMERIQDVGHHSYMLANVEKIESSDDHTVVFTLNKPSAAFLDYMANHFMWILPREAVEGEIDLDNTAIGTGPFILEKFDRNIETVFRKNPDYFIEGLPYLDKVITKIIPDPSARLAAYRSEQLDIIGELSPEDIQVLEAQFENQVKFDPLYFTNSRIFVNMEKAPFDDIRVRKAISMAIDRKEIAERIWGGGVVAGPIPSHMGDWTIPVDEREDLQPYDPEQAKHLLSEAGYPDGFDTTVMTTEGYGPQFVRTAEWILEDLRQIGINAELEIVEYATWFSDRWPDKKYDIGVGPQFVLSEPDEILTNYYESSGHLNWFGISDSTLDNMIEEQRVILDRQERLEKIHDIQRYILNDLVNPIEIATPYTTTLHRGYVKDYYPHASYGSIHTQRVWLDK